MHASHNNEQKYENQADSIMICGGDIEREESASPQAAKEARRKQNLKLMAGIIAISLLDISVQYFLFCASKAFAFQHLGLSSIIVFTRCGVDIAYILYLKKRIKKTTWIVVIYLIVALVVRNILTNAFRIEMTFAFV